MKKIIYLLLFTNQILFAQSSFDSGNALYKSGNYKDAIVAYESIIEGNKQSSDLYFNLANCYYKLNKVAPAIYNYEKALLINPNYIDAQNNLQIAQKLQVDDIKVIKPVGFEKMFLKLISRYNYNTWAWLAVYFGGLFLLFCLGYYFLDKTLFKRVFFILMCIAFLLILISILSAIFERNQDRNNKPAIVFAATAALKKEPKINSKNIILLHEGTKVFVLETNAIYKKVQLTDDTKGWLESSAIKELK